jgi:hypothetical protein
MIEVYKEDLPLMKEALAENAHKAWSDWMRYLFEKSSTNTDGSVTIPPKLVERWRRQMQTPFRALPYDEQTSDFREADKVFDVVMNHIAEVGM